MPFTKFFRNGKTFSAFCRTRYGKSKMIWENTDLWEHSGKYAIGFDIEAADKLFDVVEAHEDASKDEIITEMENKGEQLR